MRVPGALFAAALAALAAGSPSLAARSTERLGTTVVPASQEIVLDLDPAREDYTGSTTIELEVRVAVDRFRLHAEGMEILRVELADAAGRRPAAVSRVADDLVEIACDAPLAPGAWTLALDFAAPFGTKSTGLYRVEEDGRPYLFTQFESDDAREAFPCFDEPGFKIPFGVTLVVPDGLLAVSNTIPASESVEAGARTVAFERTPPMPSYLVAIAVGPFEAVEIPGMSVPGRVLTPAGKARLAQTAVETTPPILAALERWFGRRMPYEKIDLIAVPKFWPGAMENAGAITYRDDILLLDPGQAGVAQLRRLASVTAHELAHQWFGNLVTMSWWDDLWLNESFADWMGNKITDEVHPELRQGLSEVQGLQRTMGSDARPSTKPVRREVTPGGSMMEGVGLAYAKGRTVLGMLEGWMGEETFRRGVIAYLDEHAWGSSEAADLWRALDAASGHDVSGIIAGFLEQPGFPLVRAERIGDGRWRLSQGRFHNDGVEVEEIRWSVPVVLRWSEGGTVRTRSVLLDGDSREVDLEARAPVAWLYPNGGGSGYYRWWASPENLAAIAAASATELAVAERVELLGNLEALLDAGAIDGATYLRTLAVMQDDPDPQVLGAIAGAAETIRTVFVTPDLEDAFAVWVRTTLGPGLERIGRDRRADEPESVTLERPRIVAALADWGRDRELRTWAHGLAEDYLADPESVDPAIAGTALGIAAIDGDADLFARFRERLESADNPGMRRTMISTLAAFRDPDLRRGFLDWALDAVRPEELGGVYFAMAETDEGRDAYFRFARENFETLAARTTEEAVSFLPVIGGGCSEERLALARDFFGDPDRAVPGTESRIRRTADQVGDCVRLREREGAAVAAYLRALAPRDDR